MLHRTTAHLLLPGVPLAASAAAMSPMVTWCTPPTSELSSGLRSRFSREEPCAVPTSATPFSLMALAAAASLAVVISAMMMICGL
jgi:hypothetical protein